MWFFNKVDCNSNSSRSEVKEEMLRIAVGGIEVEVASTRKLIRASSDLSIKVKLSKSPTPEAQLKPHHRRPTLSLHVIPSYAIS
jgi:hypothetical protein